MPSFSQPPSPWGLFDGVLLVDKPVGPTSHDIVHKIRKTFRIEKAGHGGTLDPNATGLLIILLGKGTKLSDQLMGGDKAYSGVMRLGRTTSSQDCDGETLEEKPWDHVTREQIEAKMAELTGDIFQTPPMVSAIKVEGVPLYKLARKGQEVERKPRFVHIYRFAITEWAPPLVTFDVFCTKGTYVRTLAHDIGQALGCGACLDALRRTRSGTFDVKDALPFDEILKLTSDQLAARVIPLARATRPDTP
ncbi:MAG TPA: tRNA pseudouridine(55) synthase TruB [Kiritimatiellia bacterium]|nr:tRNA pseudouridine(55) synthase TruB [Kiritimatiellia bacterium]HPS09406.1 tRNA pseudouridine(55) synthase TruB [Kiritimatiellia bacterium]